MLQRSALSHIKKSLPFEADGTSTGSLDPGVVSKAVAGRAKARFQVDCRVEWVALGAEARFQVDCSVEGLALLSGFEGT